MPTEHERQKTGLFLSRIIPRHRGCGRRAVAKYARPVRHRHLALTGAPSAAASGRRTDGAARSACGTHDHRGDHRRGGAAHTRRVCRPHAALREVRSASRARNAAGQHVGPCLADSCYCSGRAGGPGKVASGSSALPHPARTRLQVPAVSIQLPQAPCSWLRPITTRVAIDGQGLIRNPAELAACQRGSVFRTDGLRATVRRAFTCDARAIPISA
jgi:hypothetical protein